MARRWWMVPLAGAAGVVMYRALRVAAGSPAGAGSYGGERRREWNDMPSAGTYDALVASPLRGFYRKVAREVVEGCPAEGRVLDVGCGPGRLDAQLGVMAPSLQVTGIDVDPEMIERARVHAAEAGVVGRVHFEVADVTRLPFHDEEFDCVVSTASMHHWGDREAGLREVYRVLKPGGEARIYDMSDRVLGLLRHGPGDGLSMPKLAAGSPFGGGEVEGFRWPGPIAVLRRMRFRKDGER